MLKIAICDDNVSIRTKFVEMLYIILEKNNIDGEVVFETDNPNEFYDYVVRNHVDVALLDVDLRAEMTGIDLAKKIREVDISLKIVFTTAHIEYMMLSFKVQTFDYLIKPISSEKLEECIIRLTQCTYTDNNNFLKIKAGPITHMVNKNDIIFIEKMNTKSNIYTNNEIIESYYTLEEFENMLSDNFKRCHKSYVVNIKKIAQVNTLNGEVVFTNSFKCYMGRKYKKMLLDSLE